MQIPNFKQDKHNLQARKFAKCLLLLMTLMPLPSCTPVISEIVQASTGHYWRKDYDVQGVIQLEYDGRVVTATRHFRMVSSWDNNKNGERRNERQTMAGWQAIKLSQTDVTTMIFDPTPPIFNTQTKAAAKFGSVYRLTYDRQGEARCLDLPDARVTQLDITLERLPRTTSRFPKDMSDYDIRMPPKTADACLTLMAAGEENEQIASRN